MFKNKKIVLFLLVLPLVAVLVAPKVALADDDSDWVKNIPIIGGVVDFASDPGGWITDRFAEGAEFFFNDGLQNIKTTSTKSILGKSFNNLLGKKTGTFYSTVSFVNKSVVMPTAASILSLKYGIEPDRYQLQNEHAAGDKHEKSTKSLAEVATEARESSLVLSQDEGNHDDSGNDIGNSRPIDHEYPISH